MRGAVNAARWVRCSESCVGKGVEGADKRWDRGEAHQEEIICC